MCPFCKCEDKTTIVHEIKEQTVVINHECQGCGSSWDEIYQFADIRNMIDSRPKEDLIITAWKNKATNMADELKKQMQVVKGPHGEYTIYHAKFKIAEGYEKIFETEVQFEAAAK